MSAMSEKIRVEWRKNDLARDEGLTTPAEIERYDDIVYGEYEEWQLLDLYRPKADAGVRLPVIVSIHGGAWVYGDKEIYQHYCMNLAMRGFAVVNFTYRLAPEFKFPAALEDTNLVVHWIMDNADKYDLDVDNIFMLGDSAGANILGLFCNFCTNGEYAKLFDFKPIKDFAPRAVALNCGKFTFKDIGDPNDTDSPELLADFMPNGGTDEDKELMDVIDYVTDKFPPAYVMTANLDFLKKQSPLMIQKLMECEVPFAFACYGDKKSVFYHVFHCDIRTEAAEKCNDDECAFFAKHM